MKGVVFLPIPAKNPSFFFQSEKRIRSRIRGHDKGESPVELRTDAEVNNSLEDAGIIIIQANNEGSHDADSLIVNSIDRFSISGGLVESFPHGFQVLCGEGLESDIDGDAATLREPLQELLIEGHRNRGMAIP